MFHLLESGKAMFQGVSADIEAGMWESIGKDKENIDYFIDREVINFLVALSTRITLVIVLFFMFHLLITFYQITIRKSIKLYRENIDYFIDREEVKEKKEETTIPIDISSVGSDEVGTGDYYGPILSHIPASISADTP